MNITYDILDDMGTMDTTRDTTAPRGMAYTSAVALSPRGEYP